MFYIILFLAVLAALGGLVVYRSKHADARLFVTVGKGIYAIYGLLLFIALWAVFTTSWVRPSGDQIGLLDRLYLCKPIADGRNVALPGECGHQADVIMPGGQFIPFVNVMNDITYVDQLVVENGSYANLVAKDGGQPEAGQVAAKPWQVGMAKYTTADGKPVEGNMLDARFFLESGLGKKGPQSTILQPAKYVVNPYLWNVISSGAGQRVEIKVGEVGVIKSAIDEDVVPAFAPHAGEPARCGKNAELTKDLGQIKATLVSMGCRGVWREALSAGTYFINQDLYKVTTVDTKLQNWTYAGGYTRRIIDLHVKDDGTIEQQLSTQAPEVVTGASGDAISLTVDGWQVNLEVRLQARVTPEFAPLVVAAVGTLEQVEERIISPQVRSVARNIAGSRISVKNTVAYEEALAEKDALKARLDVLKSAATDATISDGLNNEQRAAEISVLEGKIANYALPNQDEIVVRSTRPIDFQSERETLEKMVAQQIQAFGEQTGIEIVQVAFGKVDLPPELLVARKVEQLAGLQRNALIQQRTAQVQRQATEAAKARADKQGDLVQAAIDVDVSRQRIETRKNQGEAEKQYSILQAEGRKAEVAVLGEDKVFMGNMFKDFLTVLSANPQLLGSLKLPSTMVIGSGGSLEGMAAVLKGAVPTIPGVNAPTAN